jgi:hypothetical protein
MYDNHYIKLVKATNLTTLLNVNLIKTKLISLPAYLPVEIKNSISTLGNYAKESYDKYARGHDSNYYKYNPLYGYILRSTSKYIPRAYRNIIITSSLFATIKRGIYSNFNNTLNQDIVLMFIDNRRIKQYKTLFNQFLPQFTKLEQITAEVSKNVAYILASQESKITDDRYMDLSKKIINAITNETSPPKETDDSVLSIVSDYLHTKEYVQDLLELFEEE